MKSDLNNPIKFKNKKVDQLEKSYTELRGLLGEYVNTHGLSEDEQAMLFGMFENAFRLRKTEYLVESKFDKIAWHLNASVCQMLDKSNEAKVGSDFADMFYVKHSKHVLTNE